MDCFKNKKVLVTGHTGFKGSWLCAWLKQLGAEIIGMSDSVPSEPAHFEVLDGIVDHDIRVDIRNKNEVVENIIKHSPDFIFHLAAQPIVFDAYNDPFETFEVNAMGTASVLEYLRNSSGECNAVFITSDKCYDNVEWTYGYRESDRLGGKDPYSGSKGAAELVIKSYFESFITKLAPKIKIGVGRAGNVIGGGDWAPFRIVPDCVRSWSIDEKPEIRCPQATRPWQHVLEPLSGYLALASELHGSSKHNGEAFNFGPPATQNHSVRELVEEIKLHWVGKDWLDKSEGNQMPAEAGLLKLCCDKALHELNWQATLTFKETAKWTADWYRTFYESSSRDARDLTKSQISQYMQIAAHRKTFKI
ncbi:MAG: CDP-glucose 4,6-dehydratase [Verrucomicrobia bacterium]|nr:CDP-glucose 4,6-dehydratase [Verrucomicrobiota bacterium]